MHINSLQLCLVTDINDQPFHLYQQRLLQAIDGGVTAVQLRGKNKDHHELLEIACQIKSLLTPFHIPLIINDHINIAKEIDADGVHLGQTDISPEAARNILGPDKLIGLSIESLDQLLLANTLCCIDYIAASAVFQSKTKTNCKMIWGLNGLKQITQLSKHPVIAIGGINASNITDVMKNGASGVAIVSAIHDSASPKNAANELMMKIKNS